MIKTGFVRNGEQRANQTQFASEFSDNSIKNNYKKLNNSLK